MSSGPHREVHDRETSTTAPRTGPPVPGIVAGPRCPLWSGPRPTELSQTDPVLAENRGILGGTDSPDSLETTFGCFRCIYGVLTVVER